MAATFAWSQSNGAGETATDLGTSGNLFNFKAADSLETTATYTLAPITAGNSSFEVYLRGHWTGTFNTITNLQFWQSTAFSPATGLQVTMEDTVGNQTYATPSATDNANASVPTADPATANVGIAGSFAGTLSAAGFSNYIILQLDTTSSAAAGDTSLAGFSLQYDET